MTKSTDEILAIELKKLASKAAGKKTGSGAVAWVARKLPDDAFTIEFQATVEPESVLTTAHAVLQGQGRIRDDVESPPDVACLSAVIGSGFLGLNPAIVTVQVIPCEDRFTRIMVAGVAKEGLIKQRAGEKAATRIAEQLKTRLGT